MASYMLLLYRSDAEAAEAARRQGEAALWADLNDRLQESGLLVASGRLHPVDTATTVRVRRDEVEVRPVAMDEPDASTAARA